MKVFFNTMIKNEEKTLDAVLPIWVNYPIDIFVFYDDMCSDNSITVIKKHLGDKAVIINDNLPSFNEGYQRQAMIDKSIELGADYIMCIDADELLSSTIVNNFDQFINEYVNKDMYLYWYNCVSGSLEYYRNDPAYINNFRCFVLPVGKIGRLNTSEYKYHTPRTPSVFLPRTFNKDYGILHLQAINRKYYALKQLWYKHHELINYNHSISFINNRYDPVVNNLNFNPLKMDDKLISGINIDLTFFDTLAEEKGYLSFIKDNLRPELITFGKEYL